MLYSFKLKRRNYSVCKGTTKKGYMQVFHGKNFFAYFSYLQGKYWQSPRRVPNGDGIVMGIVMGKTRGRQWKLFLKE